MAKLAKTINPVTGQEYIVDLGTRNISFLQTHQELKHLGIKNNAFMLELKDITLADVDPFDPNLDDKTIYRIQRECRLNFWYYVREVVKMPVPNAGPVPLYLHRGSCAQFWLFLQHIDSTLNIPRRCYKTSNTIAGPYCWSYNFGMKNSNLVIFNYDNAKSWDNLKMMKDVLDLLPPYMRFSAIMLDEEVGPRGKPKTKKKIDNTKTIRHPVTGNTVTTRGKAANQAAAIKFGRGDAINMPYYDEAEYIDFLPDILGASGPSYQEALNLAVKNNAAACRLFTTTPGYLNIPHQRENYEKFIAIQPKWTESLYDKTSDEIREYMLNNGNGYTLILYIEYSYIQCRRDDAWLEDMKLRLNGDMLKVRTEVLLQRLAANENGPFDPYDVDYIIQHKQNPVGDILVNGTYKFDFYRHLDFSDDLYDSSVPYFIGIDPATGVGGDSTAFVGINPFNLKPAFEFKSAYISEPKVVSVIVSLIRMLPNSIVFIETRSSGSAIIAQIRAQYPDVASRLYKSEYDPQKTYIREAVPQNVTEKEYRDAVEKKLYGIATGEGSRKQIQDLWVEYIKSYKTVVYSDGIVNDITTMTKTNTGKITASNGAHDDMIMAWGFCLWGYHHGQNLTRWGFNKPEKHPLETDPMPARETKKIDPRVMKSVEAYIANQANTKLQIENRKYAQMTGNQINGHRRTFQVVRSEDVTMSEDPGIDHTQWIDTIDGGEFDFNPNGMDDGFSMFY